LLKEQENCDACSVVIPLQASFLIELTAAAMLLSYLHRI